MPDQRARLQYLFAGLFFVSISYIGLLVERYESILLMTSYVTAFASYLLVVQLQATSGLMLGIGLLCRMILFFSLPVLSDDLYRFIWDGTLLKNGVHPFENLPGYYLDKGIADIDQKLFDQLNSPDYFTIYPPLNQLLFWLSAMIGDGNWLVSAGVIRAFLVLADVGAFHFLKKLLVLYGKDENHAFWYFLNPLIILEFTGNLHFEGFVVCFLLMGVYFYEKAKTWRAATFLGLAIGTKLLPLIYLPYLFLKGLGEKKWMIALVAGVIATLTLLPLLNESFLQGMQHSLDLYFRKFEFNASIYYLAREVGYMVYGYNNIAVIGPLLSVLSLISILTISVVGVLKKWPLPKVLLFTLTSYLLLTTTIHPWYILPMVALGILSGFFYPIVWSFFIFITYVGYTKEGFHLPLYWVAGEYLLVILFVWIEKQRRLFFNDSWAHNLHHSSQNT